MQKHTANYMNFFGFQVAEDCVCEIPKCCEFVSDVHHIEPRSKFGKKRKDEQDHISNLIGLCRQHHEDAHSHKLQKAQLQVIHSKYMELNGVR